MIENHIIIFNWNERRDPIIESEILSQKIFAISEFRKNIENEKHIIGSSFLNSARERKKGNSIFDKRDASWDFQQNLWKEVFVDRVNSHIY